MISKSGFSKRKGPIMLNSNIPEQKLQKPAVVRKDKKLAYMGWVTDSTGGHHKVRIDCSHWAPHPDALDCRNGCEAALQGRITAAESKLEKSNA